MERANNAEMNPPSSLPPESESVRAPDPATINVIESLKKYNQSQIDKVLCIENDTSTLDCDVVGGDGGGGGGGGVATTTHENDMPELPAAIAKTLKKFPIYNEWVETLMDYNNELIGIIDKIHSNVDNEATQAHYNCYCPIVSVAPQTETTVVTTMATMAPMTTTTTTTKAGIPNLIDFDDCQQQCKHTKSTETSSFDEISIHNQKLIAENGALKKKIHDLERQKEGLEEAAVEARVLVFEVAERHDIILRLKNEINDIEQQLKQKDTHIQFKDEIIKKLRQQRRSYLKCPHDLSRTKLDSIDKVVDLIRTVSRDISPDPASKDCDCYMDFYQEKENQTDDELCQSIESIHEYAQKIEAQQAEIEMLNAELDKKEANYDRVSKILASLQQQLESIRSTSIKSTAYDNQVSKTIGSMDDSSATPDEVSTIIADKTHLANLITSLKSEMASANALLKSKEHDYNEAKMQVNRFKDDLNDAHKRIAAMEKQCEQYRQTIKHLEDHLKTYSDTIKKLEENQSVLKSQIVESQEKQQNFQKLVDENRKLDSNLKHQLTTISFLRTALEEHIKKQTTNKPVNRPTATVTAIPAASPVEITAQTNNNRKISRTASSTPASKPTSTSANQTTYHKWTWFK